MDHAASEQDAVDVAAQGRGHGADLLADLIDHGVPGATGRLVAGLGALAHLEGVGGAQQVDEAAGLHAEATRLGNAVAGLKVVQDLGHGQGARTRGGHRALAAHDVGAVDHLAVVVGADGDAAADVADHKAAVLVGAAHRGRVADGRLLEVERVKVHVAVHAAHAGHARLVAQLVGVGRVHHKGRAAAPRRKGVRDLRPQLGRVLHAVGAALGVVEKDVIHLVGASRERQQAAAAPHEGVHAGKVHAVLRERGLDEAQAVRQLV